MKKIPKAGILIFALIIVVILLNLIFQVIQGEGFNPSDDGVIIAQGFRIINGEIPHVDFISIRPVGSAIFHSISFALPIPVEVAARWICLLEFLITSILWSWLLFKTLKPQGQKLYILLFISTLVFVLNQNFYNLFPWTTIDAIFFFSIGYFIYWNWKKTTLTPFQSGIRYFLIIFFIGFSALCRQTFALPVLVLGVLAVLDSIKQKRLLSLVPAAIVGLSPYWIYLYTLIRERALGDFYSQLTGRTEIWETGVQKFGQQFWSSPFLIAYLLILIIFLFIQLDKNKSALQERIVSFRQILTLGLTLLLVAIVVLLYVDPTHLFNYSFVLFWLYIVILISGRMFRPGGWQTPSLHWWIIGLAWTSSISLGDNSPVFTTGLMAGGIIILLIQQWFFELQLRNYHVSINWLMVVVSSFLLGLSIYAQKENNYRDLRAGNLKFQMNSFLPDMGGIRTNSRTYSYLLEISEVYNLLDTPKNRFVVLPNASLIYPLLNTTNPMPLDWMQGAEFVGQEDDLLERLENLDKKDGIYLLFDRYNSKIMADSLADMDYGSAQYPYYQYLIKNSESVQGISSEWFDVRLWK